MNRYGLDLAELEDALLRELKRIRFGWITRGGHAFAGSDKWLRPMDLGARDSSPHSYVLGKLFRKGRIERRTRGSNRAYVYRYKLNELGRVDEQATDGGGGECTHERIREAPLGVRDSSGLAQNSGSEG